MSNQWHKSSYSSSGANCVECRSTDAEVQVRDSQHRDQGHLSFPVAEWQAFVAEASEL
ncbi:DUF397 domain-containing protein [Lipingzhangella halophila]|uniref:DUF397 domain-containing protein n=1 Tax=Lipingzhangella halophila TaxID=1783352 RepID=UPI00160C5D6B|nr:DUF397 domain-containing protein [Lipingzhangella halophila]